MSHVEVWALPFACPARGRDFRLLQLKIATELNCCQVPNFNETALVAGCARSVRHKR